MPPTPVVKAFLIADSVIQDRATGKWSVIGIFERVNVSRFPCLHPVVALYAKLTDAEGEYVIRLEFRDSADVCLFKVDGMKVRIQNRQTSVDFGVVHRNLPLKEPGRYQFQLYLNGEYVAAVPLEVCQLAPPAPPAPR